MLQYWYKPSKLVCYKLIQAISKTKNSSHLFTPIWNKILSLKISPNKKIFSSLLLIFGKQNSINKIIETFKEISYYSKRYSRTDYHTFIYSIINLEKFHYIDSSEKFKIYNYILLEMIKNKLLPNEKTFCLFISEVSRINEIKFLVEILKIVTVIISF